MSALALASKPTIVEGNMRCVVRVPALAAIASPFDNEIWDIAYPVTRDEVRRAIQSGSLDAPYTPGGELKTRKQHVERIAWFVQCAPVGFAPYPIEVDVGVPGFMSPFHWPIQDGNHRLGAAIYRDDPIIHTIVGGQLDLLRSLGIIR